MKSRISDRYVMSKAKYQGIATIFSVVRPLSDIAAFAAHLPHCGITFSGWSLPLLSRHKWPNKMMNKCGNHCLRRNGLQATTPSLQGMTRSGNHQK